MEFTPKKITVQNYSINYIESRHSSSDEKTIVCVHGFPGACNDYRKLAGFLGEGLRIVSVDLLGCGKSDKPVNMDYTIRAQADVIAQFIRILDLKDVILIGHSYGGAVCQGVAATLPDRVKGLILLASIGSIPHIIYKKLILPMVVMYGILSLPRAFELIRPVATLALKKSGFPAQMAEDKHRLTILCKTAVKIDFKKIGLDAEKIECPTLYLSCNKDPFVQLAVRDMLKKKIRSFAFVELSGDSHLIQDSHAEEIAGIMKPFIEKV